MEEKITTNEEIEVTEATEVTEAIEEGTKGKINWKEVWDKVTTGILIFLFISPVLVLLHIFLWFVLGL